MADSFNPTDLNVPNYRLIKPIGQGAFGQVWLAEEELTRIYCAVKIIPGAGSKKQGVELTGVQKYRQLSQGHPNLIQLSAPPGMDGGCLYYVMELADNAQSLYRRHIASEAGYQDFCEHFRAIIDDALEAS